jgi:flavin reductase (DIM6/NTAB) family NADH-FMN oxidoreductase RutF
MPINSELFRKAMGSFASGVTIVTTEGEGGVPYGLTVSSFASVSLDPPMVLVCLHHKLSGFQAFLDSGKFAVNILSLDQQPLSDHFAQKGTERADHIDGTGATGVPIISGSMASLECVIVNTATQGDHTVLFGQVEHVSFAEGEKEPLVYFGGNYRGLGEAD